MFKPKSPKTADVWSKDASSAGASAAVTPSALTYVGAGSELRGDLRAAGNLRIDGAIFGTVQVDGDLEVSSTGVIEGEQVSAVNVLVHGRIKAKVHAAEQLRIHGQGRVEGDVTAQSLDIEAGAHFIGYSRTGVEPQAEVLQLDHAENPGAEDEARAEPED
ncbi:bactofilin family protein [Thiomonas intermedia]|uniref:bactofilin family protein n=1 Tax=Thiomonas intermedia TaxID=926 RepID=UPI0009A524B7|nr:polymer-forming cytoskeletal protein [Thiomonas intermedia]